MRKKENPDIIRGRKEEDRKKRIATKKKECDNEEKRIRGEEQ